MADRKKAVFFDRDGVLNHLVQRNNSYYSPQKFEDFKMFDDAKEIISKVKQLGYLAIVISNQPDITRNKLDQKELDKMTDILFKHLEVDDVFYCIHDDHNDTGCRKPKRGLFLLAQKKYNINFDDSIMVGDTWKDVEAAKNAGIKMYLIDKHYNQDITNVNRINKLEELPIFN